MVSPTDRGLRDVVDRLDNSEQDTARVQGRAADEEVEAAQDQEQAAEQTSRAVRVQGDNAARQTRTSMASMAKLIDNLQGTKTPKSFEFHVFIFLLLVGVHAIDAWQNFAFGFYIRFMVWVMIIGGVSFLLLDLRSWMRVALPLSLYHLAIPYIGDWLIPSGLASIVYTNIVILVPLWPLIYLYKIASRPSKLRTIISFLYWVLVMVLLWLSSSEIIAQLDLQDGARLQVADASSAFFAWVKGSLSEQADVFRNKLGAGLSRAKNYAEAKYNETVNFGAYEAEVDRKVSEPLGVTLEDFELTSDKIERGQMIDAIGRIKVYSIGEDDNEKIKINLLCNLEKTGSKEKTIAGEVLPRNDFELYNREQEDVECKISGNSVDVGSYKMKFFTDYEFETLSYMVTYFANRNYLRGLSSSDKDFFDVNKIAERTPNAKSTNGPIKVSIKLLDPPIPVDPLETTTPLLSVKIDNIAKGVVKNLNSLVIGVPQPLTIDTQTCNYQFEQVANPQGVLDSEKYNYYALSADVMKLAVLSKIKTHRFVCRLKIDGQTMDELLNNNPYAVKSLRVAVKYNYEVTNELSFDVKKPEGFSVLLMPNPATTADDLVCEASHGQRKLSYVSYKVGTGQLDPNAKETKYDQCIDGICKLALTQSILGKQLARGDVVHCFMSSEDSSESATAQVTIRNAQPNLIATSDAILATFDGSQVIINEFKVYDADEQDTSFSVSAEVIRLRGTSRNLIAQGSVVCVKEECSLSIPITSDLVLATDSLEVQMYVAERDYFEGREVRQSAKVVVKTKAKS